MPSSLARPATILSVGTDEVLLNSRNEVLRHAGYTVIPARNCHEAVVAATSHSIDIAVICFSFSQEEASKIAHDLEVVNPNLRSLVLNDFENVALREQATSPEFLLHMLRAALQPPSVNSQRTGVL